MYELNNDNVLDNYQEKTNFPIKKTSAWRLEVAKEKRLIYNALNTLDL